jgi:hypothetical protein
VIGGVDEKDGDLFPRRAVMRSLLAAAVLFLLATTTVAEMKVRTKARVDVDLSKYQTYSWLSTHAAESGHLLAPGSPMADRVQAVGDPILEDHGFSNISSGEPDLWIRYSGFSKETLNIEGTTRDLGGGTSWVGDPGAHSMTGYRQGTLMFEMVDSKTDKTVWSGWAIDAVPFLSDARKVGKKVEKATKKILTQLP